MKIGYARVSTPEQSLDLQLDALKGAGCAQIFSDFGISGADTCRLELQKLLRTVKHNDQLIVWKLDRLGRSLSHLISIFDQLQAKGAGIHSLTEGIDTTKTGGKMVFQIMGVLAEFERDIISERTREGMAAAKRRGVHIGRPRKLSLTDAMKARSDLERGLGLTALADHFQCSPDTVRRSIDRLGDIPLK